MTDWTVYPAPTAPIEDQVEVDVHQYRSPGSDIPTLADLAAIEAAHRQADRRQFIDPLAYARLVQAGRMHDYRRRAGVDALASHSKRYKK